MWRWLMERFMEKSTWGAVLTSGATLTGMAVAPDKAEAIGTIGMLVASGIAAATRER